LLNDKYKIINTSNTYALIFAFIGGEPLIEAELMYQICDYAVKQMIILRHPWLFFFRISISSNGLLYNTDSF
jgi:hypothetical protein